MIPIIIGACIFGGYKGFSTYKKFKTGQLPSVAIATNLDIRPFNAERDTDFIKQQNIDNWYLLHNSADFDVDFMLKQSAPYVHEPRYYGKLTTVVLFDEGDQAGFVNFYMRGLYEGTVFLLAVDKKTRGKGFGEALMRYAIEGLRQQGAKYIKLSVRKENVTAKRLYERCGFKLESADDEERGFEFYRLNIE